MATKYDRYNHSPKGIARAQRFRRTAKGQQKDLRYDTSPKGLARRLKDKRTRHDRPKDYREPTL